MFDELDQEERVYLQNGKQYKKDSAGEYHEIKNYEVPVDKHNEFRKWSAVNCAMLTFLREHKKALNNGIDEEIKKVKSNEQLTKKEKESKVKRLSENKLTGVDYDVLFYLWETVGFNNVTTVSQQDIAEVLEKRKEVISRSMKKLEKAGAIEFQGKEGRNKRILISPQLSWRGRAKNHKRALSGELYEGYYH